MTPDLLIGIKWYLVFVFSTTFHEAAHAWAALRLGDDTAHRSGIATLDPTPHIQRSPFGMVVVPIVSYLMGGWMMGWASAPFDPQWAIANPKKSALMSLAGPASNLTLVLLSALFIHIGIGMHYFEEPNRLNFTQIVFASGSVSHVFATFLSITFSLNLLLFAFNLLPFPPLDGSGILMYFTNSENAEKLFRVVHHPTFAYAGMLIAWNVFKYVYPPVLLFAVNLLYPNSGYQ